MYHSTIQCIIHITYIYIYIYICIYIIYIYIYIPKKWSELRTGRAGWTGESGETGETWNVVCGSSGRPNGQMRFCRAAKRPDAPLPGRPTCQTAPPPERSNGQRRPARAAKQPKELLPRRPIGQMRPCQGGQTAKCTSANAAKRPNAPRLSSATKQSKTSADASKRR